MIPPSHLDTGTTLDKGASPGQAFRPPRLVRHLPAPLIIAGVVIAWEVLVRAQDIAPGILPAPSKVARTFWNERELFIDNLGVTVAEMALGLVIGFAVGIAAAIFIVHSPFFERTFYPIIVTSQLIPFVALAPLLVIWLGFGMSPKVIIVALGIFFPVTVNMVSGLQSADPEMINLMRSYRASKLQIFRIVEFRASMPYLHSALQIAVTYALLTAVVAEWPGAQRGLGRVMITSNSLARTDIVLGAVLLVTVISLLLYSGARFSRRFLMPWEHLTKEL